MSKRKKLYERISNNPENIAFEDFVTLIESFGFVKKRQAGSHIIYKHPDMAELLNIQNAKGEAKAYQVAQFLEKVKRFNLKQRGE
jgi:predicted RNA binding protein YcfA (HicA-like mRNA interferase family)